jgi:16S rRNA (cytosine967-C5)-methyltransferase
MPISPARAAAFDILLRVQQQDAYAAELLHSDRLDKLSSADRGLAMEIVMGVLRWQSRLDTAIAASSSRPIAKLDTQVLIALRMATYQLLFLNRIPFRAAINDSVDLVKRAGKTSAAPFANAVLRKFSDSATFVTDASSDGLTVSEMADAYAHPVWLVQRWAQQFGLEKAAAICRHDQQIPATSIRIDDNSVVSELETEGITLAPGALLTSARTVTGGDVTQTRAFRAGRVFIQDEASQLVAALVGQGSRLLDCCAAPGSKTAAIAARNQHAEIVAVELHPHRAELLKRRVHAANVQVINADIMNYSPRNEFDRVLADVPCSGTGTLARNPEIKWRLKREDLSDLHAKQVAILRAALQQLAPGGHAVYSTCSLELEENQAVLEEVLADELQLALVDCRLELERLRKEGELASNDLDSLLDGQYLRTIPGIHPCDGFFAAVLQRQR